MRRQNSAVAWNEARLNLAAHPLAWPLARVVRRLGKVVRIPLFGDLVNSLVVAHEILGRDGDFTKNGEGSLSAQFTQAMGPYALANMDGSAHRELRAKLGDILAPTRCNALLDACRSPLDAFCLALLAGRTVDFAAMTRTLSGRLTMEMMGIRSTSNEEDRTALEIFSLGERIAAALQLRPFHSRELERIKGDIDQLTGYADAAFHDTCLSPNSLVHRLRELGLGREESRGVLSIFFVAGTLTVAVALPRIVALLIDSNEMESLRESPEPSRVARAIDECLRYSTPVPATVRIASRDLEAGGHRFRSGKRIVILTANIARDREVFADPNRLNVARPFDSRSRYLWYGYGPHFCLGFPLAQREMQLVVGELLKLPGKMHIAQRKSARNVLLPSYASLELTLRD